MGGGDGVGSVPRPCVEDADDGLHVFGREGGRGALRDWQVLVCRKAQRWSGEVRGERALGLEK